MSEKNENTPLLSPSSPPSAALFPPFVLSGHKHPPSTYSGLVAVDVPVVALDRPRQQGGVASSPIVALIALGIAFFLLFGVALITPDENQALKNLLQQSAPSSPPSDSGSSYRDVTIPQGTLRGFNRKSRQGRDFTAFFKVPYAEPPLGELRFKDPVAPRGGWEGIRVIQEVAPQCIQKEKYATTPTAAGEEDCLYANIYVPSTGTTDLLPTMVYIHGGDWTAGNSSKYGPQYFMDENVILITFQWRLGAFGFLSTNDDVIHGNMGLKDQVQMLQWTKSNIRHFGGDPDRITIFGNSGGGVAVSLLMLSPMATGLFHRAISQSGASACINLNGMVNSDSQATVEEVGRVLGCETQDSASFLDCLRTKPAADIALVRTPEAIYSLTLETHGSAGQVFLSEEPYQTLRSNPNRVSYMLGVVGDEVNTQTEWVNTGLTLLRDEQLVGSMNDNWTEMAEQIVMVRNMTAEQLLSVKEFYFGNKRIGNDSFREVINLVSDRGLNHCSYVSAQLQSQFSTSYLYYLNKPPYLSYVDKSFKGFPTKELGLTAHADELQYFFPYEIYPEITMDDVEYFEFSKYLVRTWATFARDGAPQQEWQPAVVQGSSDTFWFELNDKSGKTDELTPRMDFWDGFTHKQLKYDLS